MKSIRPAQARGATTPKGAVAFWLCLIPLLIASSACSNMTLDSAPGGSGAATELGDPVDLRGKAEVVVAVVDNAYVPRVLKVSPGTRITFKNTGVNPHDVKPVLDGALSPLELNPGATAALDAPKAPNEYRFYCTIHAAKDGGRQRGSILVAPP